MQTRYNVGIYTRLSRDDERAGESVSIENQREMLTRYVKEQDWNLVSTYVDDGVSGTSFDRPGLNRMISDATDKKINLILCKDLSRFGRDYIEVGRYTDYVFPAIGCRFIALQDGVDTISHNNDMLMIFKNVLNDVYARDTSSKIKAVKQSTFKTGKYIGCYAPFGYLKDPNDHHKLIVDEVAAPIIKRIFDMRYQGYGFRRIASILNEDKVITPRDYYYQREGRPNPHYQNHLWNDMTIRKLLRNEVYVGHMVQNKRGTLSYKNHKQINKPKEEWVKVENTHEPIVSLEVWEQVCRIDKARSYPKRAGTGEISLFGGLLYCLDCGFAMCYQQEQHQRKSGDLVIYKSYKCGNYARSGKAACSSHIIYTNRLSEIVIADIQQKAAIVDCDEQDLLERIGQQKAIASREQLITLQANIRATESRHAELERLIQSLYEDKVKGKIPEDVCARLISQYEVERREKSEQAQSLMKQVDSFQTEQGNMQEWIAAIRQYKNIETLDRDILLKLIDKIEIGEREIIGNQKQREIRIHYKFVGYIG